MSVGIRGILWYQSWKQKQNEKSAQLTRQVSLTWRSFLSRIYMVYSERDILTRRRRNNSFIAISCQMWDERHKQPRNRRRRESVRWTDTARKVQTAVEGLGWLRMNKSYVSNFDDFNISSFLICISEFPTFRLSRYRLSSSKIRF